MCLAFLVLPLLLSSIPFNKEYTLVMLCSYVCFLMCLTSLVLPLLLFSIPFNKEYLLDGGLKKRSQTVKPRFYPNGLYANYALSQDDDSTIDVEACPKCGVVTLVYDCTNGSCQNPSECRGCDLCILRCDVCGKCVDGKSERIFVLNKHVPSGVDMQCVDCVACEPPRISRRRIAI